MIIKSLFLSSENLDDPSDITMYFPGTAVEWTTDMTGFPESDVVVLFVAGFEGVSFTLEEAKAMHKFFGDIIYDQPEDF